MYLATPWSRNVKSLTLLMHCILSVPIQASRHQSLDEVVEYLGGLDSDPARPGEGGAAVFKPGWEDIFRMNQKQLEGAVRRMWSDPGAAFTALLPLQPSKMHQYSFT